MLECKLNSSASLNEECLHDQASIGLEIGANFGTNYRAPGQLAVEKKVGEYSHCIGCHVSRSSTRRAVKYQNKSGCFLFLQNVRASNQGSLLIKYLNVRRKIGAKKSHQWLERPWQAKISYITSPPCIQIVLRGRCTAIILAFSSTVKTRICTGWTRVCHQYFSNAKQSFLMVMLSIDRANSQYLKFYV